jgi:hypothetical protein
VTENTSIANTTPDEKTYDNMHQAIKMHFKRMDEGTVQDFALLARVHTNTLKALPDMLINMLRHPDL